MRMIGIHSAASIDAMDERLRSTPAFQRRVQQCMQGTMARVNDLVAKGHWLVTAVAGKDGVAFA
jgi:hypothetical protein